MITSDQIRAARAALRWSSADLAAHSAIGSATIKRLEVMQGVPSVHVRTLTAIRDALESAGIEFVGTPQDRPGIRLRARQTIPEVQRE